MGSMLKFDSERRDLVRERRNARIGCKQERRRAREHKRSQAAVMTAAQSPAQLVAERETKAAVDQIVVEALDRHEARVEGPPCADTLAGPPAGQAQPPGSRPVARTDGGERAPRQSQRDRDLAPFRERRRQTLAEARAEARRRIARAGELASVADALAALEHPGAAPWNAERQQLKAAIATGRIVDVGAAARRALWAVSRDAARSARRARRGPDLALAMCVAYAIVGRLPRTALRSTQRARPVPHRRSSRRRAFWR